MFISFTKLNDRHQLIPDGYDYGTRNYQDIENRGSLVINVLRIQLLVNACRSQIIIVPLATYYVV